MSWNIIPHTDGGAITNLYYLDGRLHQRTGTATTPVQYEYGVEQEGSVYREFTKEIKVGSSGETSEWVKTYSDGAGRAYQTLYPDNAVAQSY